MAKAFLVTFGWDEGDVENGPCWKCGTDIIYAVSANEACKAWEEEYAAECDGYEGCWAREATVEEVNEYEAEQAEWKKEYEYMKSIGWID